MISIDSEGETSVVNFQVTEKVNNHRGAFAGEISNDLYKIWFF